MKYFSMFSGIGGFEYGIGERGECVGYSEIDKYAIQIYQKHFPNHINWGDARKIDTKTLPEFQLLVGGFPCQAFSIAGKQKGFEDTRGTLFFEIARVLKDKRPRYFLLENVEGLLSHENGKTFHTILEVFANLGYFIEFQILNSKDFGIPQNRRRVFIVGYFGRTSGRKIFPIRTSSKLSISIISKGKHEQDTIYNIGGIMGTIGTTCNDKVKIAIPVLTPNRENKRQNGRRFKKNGDPSFICTTQDRHGVFDGYKFRHLTPTECERLQGFPDGWTEGVSDTQRYKCLGNAVTTNVVNEIMKILGGICDESIRINPETLRNHS